MINFPTAPPVNTVVTAPNGMSWKYDGATFVLISGATTILNFPRTYEDEKIWAATGVPA